jgi:hypothetical protein
MSNETDETNCHLWPCDNPYTHCNGEWYWWIKLSR